MPAQTSLPFLSFPRANRPQAALHYREACPSVFCERFSQIFTSWCAASSLRFCWPAHAQRQGFACTGGTWRQSLWREIFAQHTEGQSIPAGLGISTAEESSSSWTAIAHLTVTFLWANPAFSFQLTLFLAP